MRIGIFGGTFDPVHLGHLTLAEVCREAARLDEVWFIPAASPPHKPTRSILDFEQRLEMLQFAIAGNQSFKINPMEGERPGPSFTADTLEEIHRLNPGDELFLLVGGDSALDFFTWRDPARILRLATLLIKDRPGSNLPSAPEFKASLDEKFGTDARVLIVEGSPHVDISSTDLRDRVKNSLSIRYQIPRAVEVYIGQKKLYQ